MRWLKRPFPAGLFTANLFENPSPVESCIFLFRTGVFRIIFYDIISPHIISFHIVSRCIVLYCIVPYWSYRIMSYQIVSPHIISFHIVLHCITSYRIVLYCIILYRTVSYRSYRIMLYHIVSPRIISYHIVFHCITLHRIVSCRITPSRIASHYIDHIVSYDITSYHTTSYCIMPYHIVLFHIVVNYIRADKQSVTNIKSSSEKKGHICVATLPKWAVAGENWKEHAGLELGWLEAASCITASHFTADPIRFYLSDRTHLISPSLHPIWPHSSISHCHSLGVERAKIMQMQTPKSEVQTALHDVSIDSNKCKYLHTWM